MVKSMEIRKYQSSDLKVICELFYETINTINRYDYNNYQIKVWSNRSNFLLTQDDFFNSMYTLVAVENEKVLGYGNIDKRGYLDHLYVHKDYQGKQIATKLCDKLEQYCKDVKSLTVHASISAKPFFEKRGYKVIKEQSVKVDNVYLTNYLMEKTR